MAEGHGQQIDDLRAQFEALSTGSDHPRLQAEKQTCIAKLRTITTADSILLAKVETCHVNLRDAELGLEQHAGARDEGFALLDLYKELVVADEEWIVAFNLLKTAEEAEITAFREYEESTANGNLELHLEKRSLWNLAMIAKTSAYNEERLKLNSKVDAKQRYEASLHNRLDNVETP